MAHRQRVISTTYPYLPIRVQLRGQPREALALVDSGFTGDLVIPTGALSWVPGLPDARWLGAGQWQDRGRSRLLGALEIVGLPPVPATLTVLGNEYRLGRGIIDQFRVIFDHGRRLIVET